MKIAVTGLSGFLGRYTADFLAEENEIYGISSSGYKHDGILVYNFDQLKSISPDVVIHCHAAVASGNAIVANELLFNGNVAATAIMIRQFPEAAHIYISSASVHGNYPGTINERSPVAPFTDYAISKYWGEMTVLKAARSCIIRLSSLYGNGMKENTLIPNYTSQAVKNKQVEVWGKGERKQNYFHISDAVLLIQAVIQNAAWEKKIFLGVSDQEYSNLEIAKIIAAETRSEIIFKNSDAALSTHYNNSFTQNSLNWHPQTTIAEGIKQYTAWKKRQS